MKCELEKSTGKQNAEKKQLLWKPIEQQHVHDGFHLLGQIKETVPSVPFIIQDTHAKIGVILLKILILCKVG